MVVGMGGAAVLGLSINLYQGGALWPGLLGLVAGGGLSFFAMFLVLRPGARMAVGPDGLTLSAGRGSRLLPWSEVNGFDVATARSAESTTWSLVVHSAGGPLSTGLWATNETAVRRFAGRLNAALDLSAPPSAECALRSPYGGPDSVVERGMVSERTRPPGPRSPKTQGTLRAGIELPLTGIGSRHRGHAEIRGQHDRASALWSGGDQDVDAVAGAWGGEGDDDTGGRTLLHAMGVDAERTLCGKDAARLPEVGPWGWVNHQMATSCGDCLRDAPPEHPRLTRSLVGLRARTWFRARPDPAPWWTWTSAPKGGGIVLLLDWWFRFLVVTLATGFGTVSGLFVFVAVHRRWGIWAAPLGLVVVEVVFALPLVAYLRPGSRMAIGPDGVDIGYWRRRRHLRWSQVGAFDVAQVASGEGTAWTLVVNCDDGPHSCALPSGSETANRRLADRLNAALGLDGPCEH